MNTAAVQAAISAPQVQSPGSEAFAAQGGEAAGGFTDILSQLLAGVAEGGEGQGDLMQLVGMLAEGGEQMPIRIPLLDDEEDDGALAMQAAMAMLGMNIMPQTELELLPPELTQQGAAQAIAQAGTEATEQLLTQSAPLQNAPQQTFTLPNQPAAEKPSMQISVQSEAGENEAIQTELEFERAVHSAQQGLGKSGSDTAGEQDGDEFDIDKLQQKVDAGKFLGNTAYRTIADARVQTPEKTQYTPSAQDIASQTLEGLGKGISSGKNEFVVRLKPEGLGEITVKLAEEGGRISINLIASNENTSKMLSGELASLKASLELGGTKLESIQVQSTNDASGYLSQDEGAQSFLRQQAGQNHFHRSQQSFGFDGGETAPDNTAEPIYAMAQDRLDTYI